MELNKLLAALPPYTILNTSDLPDLSVNISHITADSRQVRPGSLFVAYRGVNVDIHCFIPKAIQQGAGAIVIENQEAFSLFLTPYPLLPVILVSNGREALAYLSAAWYNFPARHLNMVGITGTDGKTTTTHLLYHILLAANKKVSMINTVSAVIGQDNLDTGLHTTTPDAPDLQRYLAQMVAEGTEICLLEVTSHGLAHHRVTGCHFDAAVVTNITHEHLNEHGSLENYWAAKAMLFESLAVAADKGQPKIAVLNCDDGSFAYLKEKLARTGTPWLGYSLNAHPEAAVTAANISYQSDRTQFTIQTGTHTFDVASKLVGDYNVSNCLAAAATALVGLQISPQAVQQGVAALPGVPGRMERINEGQPFLALVDFAHTPNSLRRVLAVAQTLTTGRVIAVFGCAGLRDVEKRTLMGQIAAELAGYTIITAEDPRTENLEEIIAVTADTMASNGGVEGQTFARIPDRGQAIFRAVQLARPNDVVIVLGKGHEQSMCFGEVEYPWDDREALRLALRGAPLNTLPTASPVVE
jgi:UDP-N-acetylmuramoyl-L-alanyl-D-glutamate--2,6-diaminopimelate ligase